MQAGRLEIICCCDFLARSPADSRSFGPATGRARAGMKERPLRAAAELSKKGAEAKNIMMHGGPGDFRTSAVATCVTRNVADGRRLGPATGRPRANMTERPYRAATEFSKNKPKAKNIMI